MMPLDEDPEADLRAVGAHCPSIGCWWKSWESTRDGLRLTVVGTAMPRMTGAIELAKLLQPGVEHISVTGPAGPLATYRRNKAGTWAAFRPRRRWQRRISE